MTQTNDLPKIRSLSEIGNTMFLVTGEPEKILQGWDNAKRKLVYLFRSEKDGKWGYFDKNSDEIIAPQWQEKKALINGNWVEMSQYYRVPVKFINEVTYTDFTNGKQVKKTSEALILLTDSAYKSLKEVARTSISVYMFSFRERKNKDGKIISYVDKVLYSGELRQS